MDEPTSASMSLPTVQAGGHAGSRAPSPSNTPAPATATVGVPAAPASTAPPSSSAVPPPPASSSQLNGLEPPDVRASSLYLNRELSWLEFNARVLAAAESERSEERRVG